jgi:hypothetical protein
MHSFRLKMFSAIAFAVTAIISLPSAVCAPTINSNAANVTLSATLPQSLTVSTGGAVTVTFNLVNGATANGNAAVPITTSWVLPASNSNVKLYGYFATAAQALSDGYTTPDYIPSANVLGQVSGGNSSATTYTAFSSTVAFGGASAGLQLMSQAISSTNWVGSSSNNLSLEINTPSTSPAGTYTGTLTIQAQAN